MEFFFSKKFHHLWCVLENTKNFSFFYSEVNKLTKNQGQAMNISLKKGLKKKRLYPKKHLFEHQILNKRFKNFQIVWWSLHDFSDMRNDFYFQIVVLIYTRNLWKKPVPINIFLAPINLTKKMYSPLPTKISNFLNSTLGAMM